MPELKPRIDDLVYIADTLQALGCRYTLDITSVVGFEYYSGFIFQLFVNDEKVGGGGRYDDLIAALGGPRVPASGFALYLDLLMKMTSPPQPVSSHPKIMLQIAEGSEKSGFAAAESLRNAGYVVKSHLGGKARPM
jgi:histidyl-tRNA synthetase